MISLYNKTFTSIYQGGSKVIPRQTKIIINNFETSQGEKTMEIY